MGVENFVEKFSQTTLNPQKQRKLSSAKLRHYTVESFPHREHTLYVFMYMYYMDINVHVLDIHVHVCDKPMDLGLDGLGLWVQEYKHNYNSFYCSTNHSYQ